MRNWLYYTWLAGDHIVEQAMHNIDALNWIMGANPLRAVGDRRPPGADRRPSSGHIYDHFAIDYEYPERHARPDVRRQQDGCEKKVANEVVGTKGRAFILPQFYITGANPWKLEAS